jgi:hypothetical protein
MAAARAPPPLACDWLCPSLFCFYTVSATEWWSRGEREFNLPQSWRNAAPVVFDNLEAKDHDNTHHQRAWWGFETEIAYVKREKDVLPLVYHTTPDAPARGEDERA